MLNLIYLIAEQTLAGKYSMGSPRCASLNTTLNAPELHDSLGAWSGLGAAGMALLRQALSHPRITLSVVQVVLLYAAVATLHITIPSVLSVSTMSTIGDLTPITATRMPGNVTAIGYDLSSEDPSAELQDVITSMPYLWEQRNSTRLPAGWNGTWVIVTHQRRL